MLIATVDSVDEFFAKLPRKADLVAEASGPSDVTGLFGVFGNIVLIWEGTGQITVTDPRLADALLADGVATGG